MSASKGKSTIPPQAQVPVAVVLAIFFAIVLWWRLGPKAGAAPAAPVASVDSVAVAASAKGATIEDLRALLTTIKPTADAHARAAAAREAVANNPFHLPAPPAPDAATATVTANPMENSADAGAAKAATKSEEDLKQGRALLLASLELTGTCRRDGFSMAVISGNYVKRGDVVAGFTVKEIHERDVVLRDKLGEEVIHTIAPSLQASTAAGHSTTLAAPAPPAPPERAPITPDATVQTNGIEGAPKP